MAVAIQLHPTHISRGTQTVQGTKRLPSFTARQAVANQTHQRRHNPSAVTSHNQLQPDSAVAQMSKASAAGIHRVGAHQAARSSEKPTSQNSHPNLPTSCSRLQLQLEQQHKLKLAALREEKEAQPDARRISSSCLPSEQAWIGAANIAWANSQLAEKTAASALFMTTIRTSCYRKFRES
ncbi:MAG: hypothetical protein FRX49_04191 [Trebouxia sp. A1-2]|nr:MAG: hypothetical protein FRX49_04191 [Trebouxia sp. A1-2]